MALALNTVLYAFAARTTSLTAATRHDFSAITLTIAETTSRTFRSVVAHVFTRDNQTTDGSMSSWLIGIKLGAVAFNDVSVSETIQSTNGTEEYYFRRDVTSYFTSNFGSGSSQTCQIGVQFGGVATINVCAVLEITYEYETFGAVTRTKTIFVPIESNTGNLTNALVEIGTNQVPQLTGGGSPFCPEASITSQDIFFWLYGFETNGSTNYSLALALDAEAEANFGAFNRALGTDNPVELIWKRTDMTTTAAHALKARANNLTASVPTLGAVLVYTYTYDHDASTTILNSIRFPIVCDAVHRKANEAASDAQLTRVKFMIEEPTTITLKQSGVHVRFGGYNASGVASTLSCKVGGQTARAYASAVGNIDGGHGQYQFVHRFDSGSAGGSGLTAARGENTIDVYVYQTGGGTDWWVGGILAMAYLNYHSGKHVAGAQVHNHTVAFLLQGTVSANGTDDGGALEIAATAPNIPETNYWINAFGYAWDVNHADSSGSALGAEVLSLEGPGDGWAPVGCLSSRWATERAQLRFWADASEFFDRHATDPDAMRLAIEGSRKHRVCTSNPDVVGDTFALLAVEQLITYHAITQTVERAVSGYSGGGSGLTVDLHRVDDGTKLYSTTTVAGGGFTFVSYDDTVSLYAEVQQDGTHVGRSANFAPSGLYP